MIPPYHFPYLLLFNKTQDSFNSVLQLAARFLFGNPIIRCIMQGFVIDFLFKHVLIVPSRDLKHNIWRRLIIIYLRLVGKSHT